MALELHEIKFNLDGNGKVILSDGSLALNKLTDDINKRSLNSLSKVNTAKRIIFSKEALYGDEIQNFSQWLDGFNPILSSLIKGDNVDYTSIEFGYYLKELDEKELKELYFVLYGEYFSETLN